MFESVATLYKEASRTYDTYANEKITYTSREVFVLPKSVFNAEFYRAAQVGLHPSVTLELTNRDDYDGEKLVEFEGKMYSVIRTDWNAQRDKISLILGEKGDIAPVTTT